MRSLRALTIAALTIATTFLPAKASEYVVNAKSMSHEWSVPSEALPGVVIAYNLEGTILADSTNTQGIGRIGGTSSVPDDWPSEEPETRGNTWGQIKLGFFDDVDYTPIPMGCPKTLEEGVNSSLPRMMTTPPEFTVNPDTLYIYGESAEKDIEGQPITHWSATVPMSASEFLAGGELNVVLVPKEIYLQTGGHTPVFPNNFRDAWDIGEGEDYEEFTGWDPSALPIDTYLTQLDGGMKDYVEERMQGIMINTTIPIWETHRSGEPSGYPFINLLPDGWYTTNSMGAEYLNFANIHVDGPLSNSVFHEIEKNGMTGNDFCEATTWSPTCFSVPSGSHVPEDDANTYIANRLLKEKSAGNNDLGSKNYRLDLE